MGKVVLKVFAFLLILVALFMWVGNAITKMTGGEKIASSAVTISPEGGETIFWGKGRCFTCHSIGDKGSAARCPNLGAWGRQISASYRPEGGRAGKGKVKADRA